MSLSTLTRFDDATASAILANAILQTKDAGNASKIDIGGHDFASETADLLAEIRAILGLSPHDNGVQATRRIDEFLAKALNDLLRPADGGTSALDRAGQTGRLPKSLFVIRTPKVFETSFEKYGFYRKSVEKIVHGADDLEHLLPDLRHKNSFSLFMKLETLRGVKNSRHWAIVHTGRVGRELFACSAWRVFADDVDLTYAKKPLDVFRAFADKYGAYIRFGNVRSKFIYDERTEVDPWSDTFNLAFDIEDQPKDHFAQLVGGKTNTPGLLTHGPFFCIDTGAYKHDLRRHGFYGV